jgi:nitroreductase
MNQVFEAIKGRRSIRRYEPVQLKDEELNLILEAAKYAPSGHNAQPWHFTVIQNKDMLDSLSTKTKELMAKSQTEWIAKMGQKDTYHLFHNAPTVVIVSGKATDVNDLPYSPLADCSAAIQNMLLAAHSIGIASCWVGLTSFLFNVQEEVEKLNLPEGYKPQFAVTMGYSAIKKEIKPLERKDNVVNFIR